MNQEFVQKILFCRLITRSVCHCACCNLDGAQQGIKGINSTRKIGQKEN